MNNYMLYLSTPYLYMFSENFTDVFIKLFAIGSAVIFLGGLAAWGWTHRKVKEKTKKIYARITNVTSRSEREWDSDSGSYYTKTTYSFDYEYNVDGTCYKGHGYSGFRKRNNQRIKIYYSRLHPQNSETAASRNYILRIVNFIIVCAVVMFGLCYICDNF